MRSKIHDMFDKEANRLSSAEDEIAETLEFGKMQDPYDHAPDSNTASDEAHSVEHSCYVRREVAQAQEISKDSPMPCSYRH